MLRQAGLLKGDGIRLPYHETETLSLKRIQGRTQGSAGAIARSLPRSASLLRSCCELPQRQSGMSKDEIYQKLCHLDLEAVLD
jgi:hypothetical protein